MFRMLFLALIFGGGGWGAYEYVKAQGDGDACAARSALVADQVPHALDKLSAKYPLRVGLMRAFLGQNAEVDSIVKDVTRQMIDEEDAKNQPHPAECVAQYVGISFRKEQVREEIAKEIERELLGGQ